MNPPELNLTLLLSLALLSGKTAAMAVIELIISLVI